MKSLRVKSVREILKPLRALAFVALAFLPARQARAANGSDSLQISLSPIVTLGVTISTQNVVWENAGTLDQISGLDLGSIDLGATFYMLRPATFTIASNYSAPELDVRAQAESLGDWTIDADGVAETNQLQIYALMGRTTAAYRPNLNDFFDGSADNAGDQIVTTNRRYGRQGSDDGSNDSVFQNAGYDSAGENLSNGEQRHMWLRLDLPPSTSDLSQKKFSVYLTVSSDN